MKDEIARLGVMDWEARMPGVPEEYRARCTFLRSLVPGGVRYLFSPYEYSCRGDALLRRLKFDGSLAALRLWAFIFSEKDRLFLAKEKGFKIFAAMKDLGPVPVLSYAVPGSLTFYADELWWAPCFAEEPHLLEEAARLGAGEELCFVRAALGAMVTLDYFPRPDLLIAGVGPVCDDFSAVMQLIEGLGYPIHWWEMAARFDSPSTIRTERFSRTPFGGSEYQASALPFLTSQLRGVVRRLEEVAEGEITETMLRGSLMRFNEIRRRVAELRDLVYGAKNPPLPGLEMLLAEFISIHACSEPEESVEVLDDLLATVRQRLEEGSSPLGPNPLRVFWVTPPTDAALITLLEDLGGCIAGTEYLISHSLHPLATDRPVLEAVALSCLDDPMVGSTAFRARRIAEGARRYGAEGVIVSGISGASHCPFEEGAIAAEVGRELEIPVLSFDVPYSPGRLNEQVAGRMQGFMDLLRSRRQTTCPSGAVPTGCGEEADPDVGPFEYFQTSMQREVDIVREAKRAGRGVVGIYCEFTPRELILAAGAVPVCLCGANARTIPTAETVLPSNLCPLIKSSFGYILTNRCPFYVVTDLIVAETTCDGKKKMYELIAEKKPLHVLELTQKVGEEEAFGHWLEEVRKLKGRLEEVFGLQITDERLREAIRLMDGERRLLREALSLGAMEPAVLTGRELADLRYRVAGDPGHLSMLEVFIREARGRKEAGEFRARAETPRVLLTGCPTAQGTTKLIEVIEECGALVVVQETCSGWKPLDSLTGEEGDPLEAIARKHFKLPCSCMTPNEGRTELIGRLAREFRAQAVVDLIWQACHTYNVESYLIERFVREELGLPYLKIETDYSDSDRERLKVRVQALVEMI
jgi:benzoyl-CoA reductase/2-hydroxyglutaryl-CoA dehydratase subunit BcrC/BadD/HgdB